MDGNPYCQSESEMFLAKTRNRRFEVSYQMENMISKITVPKILVVALRLIWLSHATVFIRLKRPMGATGSAMWLVRSLARIIITA